MCEYKKNFWPINTFSKSFTWELVMNSDINGIYNINNIVDYIYKNKRFNYIYSIHDSLMTEHISKRFKNSIVFSGKYLLLNFQHLQ